MVRVRPFLIGLFALALVQAGPSGQSNPTPSQSIRVTIVGSVVDASLSPLAGAKVSLERAGRLEATTTSDKDGKFQFADVLSGALRVRAELTGYPSFSKDIQVPSGAGTIRLPIVLARPGEEMSKAADAQRTETRESQASQAVAAAPPPPPATAAAAGQRIDSLGVGAGRGGYINESVPPIYWPPSSTESYAHISANRFQSARENPLSTFGADVDTASYSNIRRFLSTGQLPPRDAVRVEELINYFRFDYPQPSGAHPISLTTEIGDCPWAPSHKLVLIGARAKASAGREIEGRNIVLLVDVSGSMTPAPRLPLLRTAFGMFVDTLKPEDRLAIVTYAGSSGVVLPSTPVRQRNVVQRAIAGLVPGGSTNGAQGIVTAYRVARDAYIPGGVNRVVLATDGDFNVGVTRQEDLLRLIERERESGVFLSVLGVGTDNLKDSTMEMLADKGNGHYAYIDTLQEARRVLVNDADATLETIAKDVKFQVEFNPAIVSAWKLVGYENRLMAAEHFNDDRKDGGEMGAGHTVTVLYEVIPAGTPWPEGDGAAGRPAIDPLRYQDAPAVLKPVAPPTAVARTGEWLTVKVRYKRPEGDVSDLITQPVRSGARVQHLALASALADFGLLLRDDRRDVARWDALVRRVNAIVVPPSLAADKDGFAELVTTARAMVGLR